MQALRSQKLKFAGKGSENCLAMKPLWTITLEIRNIWFRLRKKLLISENIPEHGRAEHSDKTEEPRHIIDENK